MNGQLLQRLIYSAMITGGGLLLFYIFFYFMKIRSRKKDRYVSQLIERHLHFAGVLLFLVITFNIDLTNFDEYFNSTVYEKLRHILHIILICSIGFFFLRLVAFLKELIITHYERRENEDYKLRGLKT